MPDTLHSIEEAASVENHIKPYLQQTEEDARREKQRQLYRRNQVFGLLMAAGAVLLWWLLHTNRAWIFPSGWWRP